MSQPAKRYGVEIDHSLVDQLMEDASGKDALSRPGLEFQDCVPDNAACPKNERGCLGIFCRSPHRFDFLRPSRL